MSIENTLSPFDEKGRYIIPDYDHKRPFSSFLPGIAGKWGIPMWTFYVNRGQAVASLGVENKDHPLLEFQPANKAYQVTPLRGFRTFLKMERSGQGIHYQPFAPWSPGHPRRQMLIGMNELELVEQSDFAGLSTTVLYYILPEEPLAGLVRKLTLTNSGQEPVRLELLDGLPGVIPFGVDNGALKHVSRTIEAWMQVENHRQKIPFYRLRASAEDSAEVSTVQAGHFAVGSAVHQGTVRKLPVIVDPDLVFEHDTSLQSPAGFNARSLNDLLANSQSTSGKTPCAFFGLEQVLEPGESVVVHSVYGHVHGLDALEREIRHLTDPVYLSGKREAARDLVLSLTDTVDTGTAEPLFDAYTRQTFLDNLLRGGWPVLLGNPPDSHVYYIYSRKHGDLERDYNDFFLAAEYFSRGNGNYRDVNQNRRCDVLLNPRVEDHNLRYFLSLIQLDGYNPLSVEGLSFSLPPRDRDQLLTLVDSPEVLKTFLKHRFSPGGLLHIIQDHQLETAVPLPDFLDRVMSKAEAHLEADFGEGFWIDHWTYLLDQIDSFLAVFPDRKRELLLGGPGLPFYQSPVQVLPRRKRYVLTPRGPRQYGALVHSGESGWKRTPDGKVFTSTVLGKLILLAALKFGTLDPEGMGIEMEAGKPGWYDALNGLPGLFGSSLAESYELLRLIRFLQDFLDQLTEDHQIVLPEEGLEYLLQLASLTRKESDSFLWWEHANQLREQYRDQIYNHFSGNEQGLSVSDLSDHLGTFARRLQQGISRAEDQVEGAVPPTYFRYQMTGYTILKDQNGIEETDSQDRPRLQAKEFQAHPLPLFLEGAVRSLKTADSPGYASALHSAIKTSPLFDRKLYMFKLNAPLEEEPHEIGRARAFTPGWLENESIWLHMAYKYLLGLLQSGLYEEFWEEVKTSLVCFQPPERYGRNPLENSSFLVSSAHPDPSLHGAGFVARLSGSTAEFVNMWTLMMAGKQPFLDKDGQLWLSLRPALPAWLFDPQDQITFNFLGSIPVRYHNPQRIDSWNLLPAKIKLHLPDDQIRDIENPDIPPPFAAKIRNKEIESLDVFLT